MPMPLQGIGATRAKRVSIKAYGGGRRGRGRLPAQVVRSMGIETESHELIVLRFQVEIWSFVLVSNRR